MMVRLASYENEANEGGLHIISVRLALLTRVHEQTRTQGEISPDNLHPMVYVGPY